jgi:AraC-like DNA-binding protein
MATGLRSRSVQSHVCSLGLRCSCVPVFYGETLAGIAKFVADSKTTDRRISLAARALEAMVSHVCQDFYAATLAEELGGLRRQVAELRSVQGGKGAESSAGGPPADAHPRRPATLQAGSRIEDVLAYVGGHYLDADLSLAAVSRALGLSDKYLTHLFTQVVGQRMHAYIIHLRVQHACRQLLNTRTPIKRIAYESGFRHPDRFCRAFRQHVGVAPSTYRRIFTGS